MSAIANINRKDQIAMVAQNMFREKGYVATSMRDLAAEIGIEPASLYSHYRSKDQILKKICFEIADQFFDSIDELKGSSATPSDRLKEAIEIHVAVIKNNADAFAVFLNDWMFLVEPDLSQFKKLRREYESIFRNIIRDGIKKGEFKDMNEKFAVLTLFASMNWIYLWYKPSGEMSPKEIADNIAKLVLHGFITK